MWFTPAPPLGKATSPEEQERQAEALAGLKGSIISAWVSAQYPDAELYADVAIYTGNGPERLRPLEVFAYDENGALNEAELLLACTLKNCYHDSCYQE